MNYVQMSKDFVLNCADNLHEIFSECYLQNTDKLLLHACNLPDAFFDISSKMAGELMQKLTNYRMRTAIVMSKNIKTSSLFSQMTGDANRFGCVRFFETEEQAKAWLTSS